MTTPSTEQRFRQAAETEDGMTVSAGARVAPVPLALKTALLLIAHGSREPEANADLYHVVEELRQRRQVELVEASFLELAEPDIDAGGSRCVELGARQVILLPYFLSAGIHVRRDLTAARQRLAERFPRVDFRLAEPLGRHPLLIDVLAERAQAVGDLSSDASSRL